MDKVLRGMTDKTKKAIPKPFPRLTPAMKEVGGRILYERTGSQWLFDEKYTDTAAEIWRAMLRVANQKKK